MTASSLYLSRYHKTNPSLLADSSASPSVIQPCYIDPSATIAPSAKIGPNVAIGPFVNVGEGVRVKDAIVMEGTTLEKHSCVLNSIVGTNCNIGPWARVDGLPEPEQDTKQISVTVLATEVSLAPETLVRSCIVLPNVRLCSILASRAMLTLSENAQPKCREPSLALIPFAPSSHHRPYVSHECLLAVPTLIDTTLLYISNNRSIAVPRSSPQASRTASTMSSSNCGNI